MAVSLLFAVAPLGGQLHAQSGVPVIQWQEAPAMTITPGSSTPTQAPVLAPANAKPVSIGAPQEQKTIVFNSAASAPVVVAQVDVPAGEMTTDKIQKSPQPPIQRTLWQVGGKPGEDASGFYVQTELPGRDRLFGKRSSEREFRKWIEEDFVRTEAGQRVIFPESVKVTNETYRPRTFSTTTFEVTPFNVCHGRLYFEQKNFDRQGWEIGYLQPLLSTGVFYYDVFMLPYHSWTDPCVTRECSAGKCLPGDRTPLYCYPERFSVTGLVGQTLAIGTGFFIFP